MITHGLNAARPVSLGLKAMKDVTLNDGTVVPKGTLVAAASYSVHHDNAYYDSPYVYDPFRFARMRGADGEGTKHQFVNTSVEYMAFGHGRHAWCVVLLAPSGIPHRPRSPGRFFASNELKSILAFIILNYDVKLTDKGRPESIALQTALVPDPSGEVMFRKRQVSQ